MDPTSRMTKLLPALARLDRQIERALQVAPAVFGEGSEPDGARGICIGPEEIDRLLARSPGAALFSGAAQTIQEQTGSTHTLSEESLRDWFELTGFDLDVLLVALAPEIDLRYERIYAYLQDDITRKRPSVDLALNLLCDTASDKLEKRLRFESDAPLVRHGLIKLSGEEGSGTSTLSRFVQLDERIVGLFLGAEGLDAKLKDFCELQKSGPKWNSLSLDSVAQRTIPQIARQGWAERKPVRFYFHGRASTGKRKAAAALGETLEISLLVADFSRIGEAPDKSPGLIRRLFREALLQNSLLYLTGLEQLRSIANGGLLSDLFDALDNYPRPAILSGQERWTPLARPELAVIPVEFRIPDSRTRREVWDMRLTLRGLTLEEKDFDDLAARFRLTAGQIAEAVEDSIHRAEWRTASQRGLEGLTVGGADDGIPALEELYAAARAQSGHELEKLSRKITPRYGWDEIVLPEDQLKQLREICDQACYREVVFDSWGFEKKLSLGKGLNVLFAGPPGTGKTMAAEVLARELKLDLYKIDLAQIISKYIGETEKNLDRIFHAAENSNAILFFDEADALFGKRSEVRDSHDRYANIEISYLLQKMEEYEGISILATNLRQNLDDAFVRRLQAIVEFPFPDDNYRRQIWAVSFPAEAPLRSDIDFMALGRYIPLAGGNVKNMALAASFFAAASGGEITMTHIVDAARREFQKLGRSWMPSANLVDQTTREPVRALA